MAKEIEKMFGGMSKMTPGMGFGGRKGKGITKPKTKKKGKK